MLALHELAWPLTRLGEAIETVARKHGLLANQHETPTPPDRLGQDGGVELGTWLETTAAWLGLEAEPVEASYAEVAGFVRSAGPALLALPGTDTLCFLALLEGHASHGDSLRTRPRRASSSSEGRVCGPL